SRPNRDTINDLYTEVFEAAPQARVIELLIRYYENIFEDLPECFDASVQAEGANAETSGNQSGASNATGDATTSGSGISSTQFPLSPPLSPTNIIGSAPNPMSSDSNLFSNSNITASIG